MMRVVGIGAGGHAKVLIDALRLRGDVEIVGLTDKKPELWSKSVLGVAVLGDESILGRLRADGVEGAFIAVGSVGDATIRRQLYDLAVAAGFEMIRVIHPSAVVAESARIAAGAMLLATSVVNADAGVGENTIVNTAAVVEHDCIVGRHVHLATGAKLASTVTVGDEAHIGAGAVVRQCISIGSRAVVGAGAVVISDVEPGARVAGVPARPMERRTVR
jgi:sugar O-acyltransferase (sialic acid O-acetyltransferase NeuD family)